MAIHSAMNTRQDEERAEPELCRMDADWRERIERLTAMRARTPAEIAAKSAVAKVTYDRLAPLGVLGEEADRLLQSLFRDIAESCRADAAV